MTDTQNRVLSIDEVIALEEGARVWVEFHPDTGNIGAKFCDQYKIKNGSLRNKLGDIFTPGGAGHRCGNFRVWSLPQPPTPQELEKNPWEVQDDG